jgi:hypothetical protein
MVILVNQAIEGYSRNYSLTLLFVLSSLFLMIRSQKKALTTHKAGWPPFRARLELVYYKAMKILATGSLIISIIGLTAGLNGWFPGMSASDVEIPALIIACFTVLMFGSILFLMGIRIIPVSIMVIGFIVVCLLVGIPPVMILAFSAGGISP